MTKNMTIDIGPDPHEWNTVSAMAPLIGVSTSAIYMALDDGRECNGYVLETRDVDENLRDELGLHHSTKTVVRVSREEPRLEQRRALRRAKARLEEDAKAPEETAVETATELPSIEEAERLHSEAAALSESVGSMTETLTRIERELPERLQEFELVDAVRCVSRELELARERLPTNLSGTPLPEAVEALRARSDVDLEDVVWRFLADEILPAKAKSEFARVLRARRSA